MDLANAALLIATVVGIASQLKVVAFGTWHDRTKVGIVNGAAFAAVFLVGATAWADEQVIGDVTLAVMSVGDKILVAVFASGAASAAWEALGAIKSIGQNPLTDTQRDALDVSAAVSAERLIRASEPDGGGSHGFDPVTPPT